MRRYVEVDEIVRPHEYTKHGDVVSNTGAYTKRGQSAVQLNPPSTGALPRFDGPTVSVKFHVVEVEAASLALKRGSARGARSANANVNGMGSGSGGVRDRPQTSGGQPSAQNVRVPTAAGLGSGGNGDSPGATGGGNVWGGDSGGSGSIRGGGDGSRRGFAHGAAAAPAMPVGPPTLGHGGTVHGREGLSARSRPQSALAGTLGSTVVAAQRGIVAAGGGGGGGRGRGGGGAGGGAHGGVHHGQYTVGGGGRGGGRDAAVGGAGFSTARLGPQSAHPLSAPGAGHGPPSVSSDAAALSAEVGSGGGSGGGGNDGVHAGVKGQDGQTVRSEGGGTQLRRIHPPAAVATASVASQPRARPQSARHEPSPLGGGGFRASAASSPSVATWSHYVAASASASPRPRDRGSVPERPRSPPSFGAGTVVRLEIEVPDLRVANVLGEVL